MGSNLCNMLEETIYIHAHCKELDIPVFVVNGVCVCTHTPFTTNTGTARVCVVLGSLLLKRLVISLHIAYYYENL